MRIALVSKEFAPFHGSGIGTYAAHMTRALTDAGHEVHALTYNHPGLPEEARTFFPDATFHTVDYESGPASLDAYGSPHPRHAMAVFTALRTLHEEHRFDYIELPDFGAEAHFLLQARRTLGQFRDTAIGLRLHMPLGLIHACNRRTWHGPATAIVEAMEQRCFENADLLIAPCAAILQKLETMGFDTADRPDRPAIVLPYPITGTPLERPQDDNPPLPIPQDGTPTVLFFGRFEPRKGADRLLRAGAILLDRGVNARFLFIGNDTTSGPLDTSVLADLKRQAAATPHPDRFRFEPARSRLALQPIIEKATACCFPSSWDNYPFAILEAMARGAPIVAGRGGGVEEMLQHEQTGLLVPPDDDNALADALQRLLTDDSLRTTLGRNAAQRLAERTNPETIVNTTIDTVRSVLEYRRDTLQPAAHTPATSAPASPDPDATPRPEISVVVPFHNLASLLPETLDALASQKTDAPFEVVIADDASSRADARQLIDHLAHNGHPGLDLRIVRREHNGGPAAARNTAINAARARLIVPIDADDLPHPDLLEKLHLALRNNPDAAYATCLVRAFEHSPAKPIGGWLPIGLERDILWAQNVAGPCTAMFHRPILEDAGLYAEDIPGYEDWDLYCTLAERAHRAEVVPEFLLDYRVRKGSRYRSTDLPRHGQLLAMLIARHPDLPEHPHRAARLLVAEGEHAQRRLRRRLAQLRKRQNGHTRQRPGAGGNPPTAHDVHPLRYRAADQAHGLLQRARLDGLFKAILRRGQ